MACSKSHHNALFSLIPINKKAEAVVNDPQNHHLTSQWPDGTRGLDIGFHICSKSPTTLATLGRGDCDVIISDSEISRLQCSFEIHKDTHVVMLYDRSYYHTTQVFGNDATPFELGRDRKVVIHKHLNTKIGMGGKTQTLIMFDLLWYFDVMAAIEKVQQRQQITFLDYKENPRLARTAEATASPGQTSDPPKIRYSALGLIGRGCSGTAVLRVIHVDSGNLMAVKRLRPPQGATDKELDDWKISLNREAKSLGKLDHPHIVVYIGCQGLDTPDPEIIMGLMDGSLDALVSIGEGLDVDRLCCQMLLALRWLNCHNFIHRDVKPENILYKTFSDGHEFQLSDFKVCTPIGSAWSFAGTIPYMAPEVWTPSEKPLTSKVDVWSLYVTMLWTLEESFRTDCPKLKHATDVQQVVALSRSMEGLKKFQRMAVVDPDERAEAIDILQTVFHSDVMNYSSCNFSLKTIEEDAEALSTANG
ncbi:serine/threonine protein kinase [Emergomyces pasteurianus Ep9510]|uniref:mitogen-activated protein kinase kinase n=1 Tax=Emergomyces pasteurianus Ep9510 TaxID=1447872 RepID=A0A1J9PQ80_9EURO|nr:serine/threonine protein kinase [Emergomyces pasteurianus Ep9510]